MEDFKQLTESPKKTIFLIWSDKDHQPGTNKELNHGIGDKIKGALHLHQYCQMNNFNLIMDGSTNILNKFFANHEPLRKPSNPDDALPENLHVFGINVICSNEDFVSKINEFEKSNNDELCIYFWTEVSYKLLRKPNDADLDFIKRIVEPRDFIKREIEENKKKIPANYGIRHFRFNDNVLINDVDSNDLLFKLWFEELKNSYLPTDLLFTNSTNFKTFAKKQLGISIIDCEGKACLINHTVFTISDKFKGEENVVSIKNTVIEFLLLKDAKYIVSNTSYHWCSNFVRWPALIYDIPLKCMKTENLVTTVFDI
jgi:hypothetical protein